MGDEDGDAEGGQVDPGLRPSPAQIDDGDEAHADQEAAERRGHEQRWARCGPPRPARPAAEQQVHERRWRRPEGAEPGAVGAPDQGGDERRGTGRPAAPRCDHVEGELALDVGAQARSARRSASAHGARLAGSTALAAAGAALVLVHLGGRSRMSQLPDAVATVKTTKTRRGTAAWCRASGRAASRGTPKIAGVSDELEGRRESVAEPVVELVACCRGRTAVAPIHAVARSLVATDACESFRNLEDTVRGDPQIRSLRPAAHLTRVGDGSSRRRPVAAWGRPPPGSPSPLRRTPDPGVEERVEQQRRGPPRRAGRRRRPARCRPGRGRSPTAARSRPTGSARCAAGRGRGASSRWWRWSLSALGHARCARGARRTMANSGVEDRHAEDDERDEQRGEEEERLAAELRRRCCRRRASSTTAMSRPEQQRAAVAHEDPGRVEVVGQEPEADAEHDARRAAGRCCRRRATDLRRRRAGGRRGRTRRPRWPRCRRPARRARR